MKKLILFVFFVWAANFANAQWKQTNINSGNIFFLTVDGTNIFAGTTGGLRLSTNNGSNWAMLNNGLTSGVSSLAISGNKIFAGTYLEGVFLSTNNGSNWATVNNGLTNDTIWSLAISGSNIFAGTNDGVYLSSNNGNSWTAVNNGLPQNSCIWSLAVSGSNIFAGTITGTISGGMYLSTNNGSSWTLIKNGLPIDTVVSSFAISGNNIFAGTWSGGVFLSTNNGSSWTVVNNGLKSTNIYSLAISGNNIFAGTHGWYGNNSGVYLSTNNGSSWVAVNNGFPTDIAINSLAISGNNIFAGTQGTGVWKRPLSEITGIEENPPSTNPFTLYPNPITNKLNIALRLRSGDNAKHNFEILNVMGQNIYTAVLNEKTDVDMSRFPSGVYMVRMFSDESAPVVKRFVKE